jgi:hypothetical protein
MPAFTSYLSGYQDRFVTTTSAAVSPLGSATAYYYRVRAVNASGASDNSNTISVAIPTTLQQPQLSVPSDGSTDIAIPTTLHWTPVTSATGYELQTARDSLFTNVVLDDSAIASTSRQIDSLNEGTIYYWRVRGRTSSQRGPYSVAWRFSTFDPSKTAVDLDLSIPLDYVLHQNYPNPFNPDTRIQFGLPSRTHVTIKVFDALGREIGTLENSVLDKGYYTRTWSSKGSPSGVYFCRMQAGNFIEVRKMVLMK